jgi:hypothetical protein
MKQYLINIISDNRGGKNYSEVVGEGSTYAIAKKRAEAEAQKAIDEAGADYISRWAEAKRDAASNDERWHDVGEYCR